MQDKNHPKGIRIEIGSKTINVASYILFGRILTFAMIGIALILVTRILGPTQYGIYTLAVAFAGIFGSIGYFGVGTALNKFIAEYKEKKDKYEISTIFSNALFLVIITGVVLTAISFLLSNFISGYIFHTSSMSYVIKAVSFWIITAMLFGTVYDSLLGFGNGRNVAIAASIQAFFQAGISIVLALMGFGALAPIFGLVFGYFIGFIIGITLMFRYNKLHLTLPSAFHIKKLVGFSLPVATASIFGGLIGSFGLVLLGYFTVPAVLGNIGIASRTSSLLSIVFDSISFAILPTFSAVASNLKLKKQIGRLYGYTVYLAILFVSPLLFYIAIFSLPFSYTLFGGSYSSAPLYMSVLSIGLLIGIAGSYANTVLISSGHVKLSLKYNSMAYIIIFILFVILIPLFGGLGYALVSFLIAPLLLDIIIIKGLLKLIKVDFRIRKLLGIIIANILVSLLLYPLYFISNGIMLLVLAAAGFCILYPLISVIMGGADKGDTNTIKELSKGIPVAGRAMFILAEYADLVIR